VVDAAHGAGLAVTAHALTAAMVERALDAGIDELAHTPVEALPAPLVQRIASADVAVVSTLQCHSYSGRSAATANAAALHRAGVRMIYGTDLGNSGTITGADPRELERLAECGLGRLGALRAATEGSAAASGMRAGPGRLDLGGPAALVLLKGDPLSDPQVWREPLAVCAAGRLLQP
ncbi:MAG: amidohydrolase family protein, partial [Mycobacteriales bacterium]